MTPKLLRSDNGTKNLHRNIFDETKLLCHFLVTLLFRTQDGVSETEKIIPTWPRWKPRWLEFLEQLYRGLPYARGEHCGRNEMEEGG